MSDPELAKLFSTWSKNPPATRQQIDAFQATTGLVLPQDYAEMMLLAHGLADIHSGLVFVTLDELVANTFGYNMDRFKVLYIGGDGGGDTALALDYRFAPPRYVRYFHYEARSLYLGATIHEVVTHITNDTRPKKPKNSVKSNRPFMQSPPPPNAQRGQKSGLLWTLQKRGQKVHGIAVSPEGHRAVICTTVWAKEVTEIPYVAPDGSNHTIRFRASTSFAWQWNLDNGELIDKREMPFPVSNVIRYVNGDRILVAARKGDSKLIVGNIADASVLSGTIRRGNSSSPGGVFSEDGGRVFCSSTDGFAEFIDSRSGQSIAPMPTASNQPFGVAFSPDGSHLYLTLASYGVKAGGKFDRAEDILRYGDVLKFGPTGDLLAIIQPFGDLSNQSGTALIDVAPDSRLLLVNSNEALILAPWNDSTSQPPVLTRIITRLTSITAARFLGDGSRIALLSKVGFLYIHDADGGMELARFHGEAGDNELMSVSKDGSIILTANGDGNVVRVWHIAPGHMN